MLDPTTALPDDVPFVAATNWAGGLPGLRIPSDRSVVGFDDLPLAELVDPPLTTIHQPLVEMATTATELALARRPGKLGWSWRRPCRYGRVPHRRHRCCPCVRHGCPLLTGTIRLVCDSSQLLHTGLTSACAGWDRTGTGGRGAGTGGRGRAEPRRRDRPWAASAGHGG
ncbi:substrate-binding domain-containing protein [Solwaraspora sp. WMMD937]|nr:substrate-binding domain-containing protein [Solwaraspora sp. WMMD937]WFE24572.1 substrate-binding domain-containing protein [Solwaraspora sp. WMMD937]